MHHPAAVASSEDPEIGLVSLWLRKDPTRWLAGAIAGLFAGAVALIFAGILARSAGHDFWFPVKLGALPIMSMASGTILVPFVNVQGQPEAGFVRAAMEEGFHLNYILAGAFFWEFIAMILGAFYAHFAATDDTKPLLGMGLVWGTFSWIFIGNLFLPAWKAYLAAHVPQGATFPVMIVFGITLATVAFFDRMIRGSRHNA